MKKVKKTATKKEKKQVHKAIVQLKMKDWDIVAHVIDAPAVDFDWFGEKCFLDKLFINKYGMCVGCICVPEDSGKCRIMDPALYDEFINNGGEGW